MKINKTIALVCLVLTTGCSIGFRNSYCLHGYTNIDMPDHKITLWTGYVPPISEHPLIDYVPNCDNTRPANGFFACFIMNNCSDVCSLTNINARYVYNKAISNRLTAACVRRYSGSNQNVCDVFLRPDDTNSTGPILMNIGKYELHLEYSIGSNNYSTNVLLRYEHKRRFVMERIIING